MMMIDDDKTTRNSRWPSVRK